MEIKKFGEELTTKTKRYAEEPIYYIGMYSNECSFQVLVNDMPLWSFFEQGGMPGTLMPINGLVPQSGKQTVTIRIFPPVLKNFSLNHTIGSNAKLRIRLAWTDWKKTLPIQSISDSLIIIPINNGRAVCEGLPYAEYTTNFELKVPYEIKGWSNGIDLRKEDRNELEMETIAIYETFRKVLMAKNIMNYLKYTRIRMFAYSQALYRDNNVFKDYINDMTHIFNSDGFSLKPIENYTLKFYGNGRVVSLERIDLRYRDNSVLMKNYVEKGKKRMETDQLYLYRPSKNVPLEPIR